MPKEASLFYLTTPLYYVSDKPHIGHAYTTIVADAICRYQRIKLGEKNVYFLTGTDEHGEKIERAAKAKDLSPKQFVDQVADSYKEMWAKLHIAYNDFIRTTQPRHESVVKELWETLEKTGDIYQGAYEGWYCVPCESFYPEKELLPELLCPDHKRKVERVKEEGYFFRLSKYEKPLLAHYEAYPDFVQPEIRKNEVRAFVERGLKDISISRSSFSWGIPVPNTKGHVIYVWIDALTNYYSALKDSKEHQAFFGTKEHPLAIHLIGKEISRFHAVYWPAILMAASLPMPKQIFAHGWWTVDGEKMSKTLGNVVDPHVLCQDIGADALRYFLLREIPLGQDGDFSYDALLSRYNSELANDLGNLLHRTLSMVDKFCKGVAKKSDADDGFAQKISDLYSQVDQSIGKLQPSSALDSIFRLIRDTNAYLEHKAPFHLIKTDPKQVDKVLYNAMEVLRHLSMLLHPFMPERMRELRRQLGLSHPEQVVLSSPFGGLQEGTQIQKGDPLFPRLDKDAQTLLLEKWRGARKMTQQTEIQEQKKPTSLTNKKELVSFSEFQRLDLRVATILTAERVPKKDKLLKITVDLGEEQKTVVAGIGQTYQPTQLVGLQVAFVANLQEAKIGGIVSQGMILAIGDNDILGLLRPEKEVPAGSVIR